MITILQWNIAGYRTKFAELKVLLEDFSPACVCLQETLLSRHSPRGPNGYSILTSLPTRADDHERGSALLVSNSVPYTPLPLRTPLQAVAARVCLGKIYTVCSLYLPHVPVSKQDITDLLTQLPRPFLLLGDMNAKSPLWGEPTADPRGRLFEDPLSLTTVHPLIITFKQEPCLPLTCLSAPQIAFWIFLMQLPLILEVAITTPYN